MGYLRGFLVTAGQPIEREPVRSRLRAKDTALVPPFETFMDQEISAQQQTAREVVTLFLGGPQPIVVGDVVLEIPFIPGWLSGMVWFFAKLMVFLFMYVWLRATLPRFRYDQLMNLGWKVLIPLAFAWFMLITALRVADDQGWNQVLTAGIALAVGLAGYLLLYAALRVAARNRAVEGTRY
jgi:NADH-quinone oxidoreductase subunit H